MAEETKTVTVQEVIDAVAQDGFEHLRGRWIDTFEGKITGGCVLQQGAINLHAVATDDEDSEADGVLYGALNQFLIRNNASWVQFAEKNAKYREDEMWKAAELIVTLNDAVVYNEETGKDEYLIPTYPEVAKMVAEVLEPFKDQEITLIVKDWKAEFPHTIFPQE